MKTDRELLEAAARAAGLNPDYWPRELVYWRWNPLNDNGDALRLAVTLGIEVGNYHQCGRALAYHGGTRGSGEFWEEGEPLSATRRAIVRAAASMTPNVEVQAPVLRSPGTPG